MAETLRPELDRKTLLSRESCFRQLLSAGRIFHIALLHALVPAVPSASFAQVTTGPDRRAEKSMQV